MPTQNLEFENRPAVGRVTVSSPAVIRPLAKLNDDKAYPEQIKPFNFLLTCHVKAFGHPKNSEPEHFHLIALYDNNSTRWLKMSWIDQYTGTPIGLRPLAKNGTRQTARVKTYGDILREYEYHPESKCADGVGNCCEKQTIGLLRRRHICIDHVKYIGKESKHLEAVDAELDHFSYCSVPSKNRYVQLFLPKSCVCSRAPVYTYRKNALIHCEKNIYTEYIDQSRDEWQTKMLPTLKRLPLSRLISEVDFPDGLCWTFVQGRSRPHPKSEDCLTAIVRKLWVSSLPAN